MSGWTDYFAVVEAQFQEINRMEGRNIETAAQRVADSLMANKFVYAFGSGHSHVLAEEMFYRAGGFARVIPILDSRLMVHEDALGSTNWERVPGLAREILQRYALGAGDILFLISNSGRNPVPVEMALEGVARGACVVAISCVKNAADVESRHLSGKKVQNVAHLVIDNHTAAGDAAITINGANQKSGPTSTITSALILNAIMVEAAVRMCEAGKPPEIWGSANGDATNNQALVEKYKGRIPHL